MNEKDLRLQPQASCSNETYVREAVSATHLGWCVPLPRPSFTVFEAKDSLDIKLVKPGATSMTLRIVVVAYKTTGTYGIQKGWLDRGLGLASGVQLLCTERGEPTPCLPSASCSTVWLGSENCTQLNTSHVMVHVDGDSFEPGSAVVHVDAFARSLPEGTYNFFVALPLFDNTTWLWKKIQGEFTIVSVASATNSEVLLNPMSIERPSITGSRGKAFAVVAKDIDSNRINRSGVLGLVQWRATFA